MAEDIADRYVIIGLENRTANRPIIILTRCFLNPGRSFANVLAFKRPWNRDTRIGLFGSSYLLRKQVVEDYKSGSGEKLFDFVRRKPVSTESEHSKEASIELAAYPYFEHYWGGRTCIGGGGSGAARLSPTLQWVAEINGCLMMGMPAYNDSGDALFYGGGLRWTPQASHRWAPYGEFLFGGTKLTYEVDDPSLKQSLLAEWNDGNGTLHHSPSLRLVDRGRDEWPQPRRRRRSGLGCQSCVHIVSRQPAIHSFMDRRCRTHPRTNGNPVHDRGCTPHRDLVIVSSYHASKS